MATTDKRGKKIAGADIRLSEEAKASLPAYGFEGMTIGEITDATKERKARERANDRPPMSRKWYE